MMNIKKITENEYYAEDKVSNVGIQRGTSATSVHSTNTNNLVKIAGNKLGSLYSEILGFTYVSKLPKHLIPYGIGACAPDGGIILFKDIPIFAAEAKYQGGRGNAIERWHKNNSMLRMINKNISYVTFASGDGAKNVIPHALNFMHKGEPNVVHVNYNTLYLNPDGFLFEDVYDKMKLIMYETIKGL